MSNFKLSSSSFLKTSHLKWLLLVKTRFPSLLSVKVWPDGPDQVLIKTSGITHGSLTLFLLPLYFLAHRWRNKLPQLPLWTMINKVHTQRCLGGRLEASCVLQSWELFCLSSFTRESNKLLFSLNLFWDVPFLASKYKSISKPAAIFGKTTYKGSPAFSFKKLFPVTKIYSCTSCVDFILPLRWSASDHNSTYLIQRAHSCIRGYFKVITRNHIKYREIMQATYTYAKFHYVLNFIKIKVQISALINF